MWYDDPITFGIVILLIFLGIWVFIQFAKATKR